jgi:hypothetical protein
MFADTERLLFLKKTTVTTLHRSVVVLSLDSKGNCACVVIQSSWTASTIPESIARDKGASAASSSLEVTNTSGLL